MERKQLKFRFGREDKLRWIEAIDPGDYEIAPRAWRTVREFLRQIEYTSHGDKCFARMEVLAQRCGVTVRTAQRARAEAEQAGLLEVRSQTNHNGQASNIYMIQYPGMRDSELSPPGDITSPPGDEMSPTPDEMSPTPDEMSPPIRNNNLLELSRRSTEARRPKTGIDWNEARRVANRVQQKIGRCRSPDDRALVIKTAALAQDFGENWLWDSVTGCERIRPDNPFAYLYRSLENATRAAGRIFSAELAAIEVPPEILAPQTGSDLRERLCTMGGDFER